MVETQRKFKERGYKSGQINTAIEKILNKTSHGSVSQKEAFLHFNYPAIQSTLNKWRESFSNIGTFYDPMRVSVMCFRTSVVLSRGRNLRDQLVNSDLPPQDIPAQRVLRPYWMETTSVMAVLNTMELINVDPSKQPQTGKQIPIKRFYHVLH